MVCSLFISLDLAPWPLFYAGGFPSSETWLRIWVAAMVSHSTGPLARQLARSLALLTHLLAPLHLFIRSLAHSITPELLGKSYFPLKWTRRFHTVSTHCAQVSARSMHAQFLFRFQSFFVDFSGKVLIFCHSVKSIDETILNRCSNNLDKKSLNGLYSASHLQLKKSKPGKSAHFSTVLESEMEQKRNQKKKISF